MNKKTIAALVLTVASLVPAFRQASASPQTVEGVISDSMCVKKHMMPGKSDADCVAECVKEGSKYVLVAGNKVYTLSGKPQAIAPFAGKHVQVQGEVKDNAITVTAVKPKQG